MEDEAIVALDQQATLEGHGYAVSTVSSGAQAVGAVTEDGPFDLVLMDIDLGDGIDGTEAARRILAIRPVPIVFLTSHAEAGYVERTASVTSYGYVMKHAGEFVLLETVRMALRLHETTELAESRERQLLTRVNELSCLYELETLMRRRRVSLADQCRTVIELLVGAVSRPGEAYGRIRVRGIDVSAGKPTPSSCSMSASVFVEDLDAGTVEVGYGADAGHVVDAFLPEERTLLAVAADRLGSWIEQQDVQQRFEQRDLRWRSLYERATIGIALFDPAHRVIDANPAAVEMLGYSREEFRTLTADDLVHPDDQAVLSLGEAVSQGLGLGPTHRLERRYRTRGGDYVTVLRSITRLEGLDDEVSHVVMFTDITDRKRTEAQVLALLEQKEALLDEVHHRIRNNMNSLMGLLSLQAQVATHPAAQKALLDARTRVSSMATLYARLYQTGNTAAMPLDLYLDPLVDEVVSLFPAAANVAVCKEVDGCELDSKTLATVGTIVNELLTNAMKYAFPGGRHGTLSVSASLVDRTLTVTVADDGVGMASAGRPQGVEGLGTKLVKLLAEQLDGSVLVESRGGTRVSLDLHPWG